MIGADIHRKFSVDKLVHIMYNIFVEYVVFAYIYFTTDPIPFGGQGLFFQHKKGRALTFDMLPTR